MGRITISKQRQPKWGSPSLKGGRQFYRVKNPVGETIEDFKTKIKAQAFVRKLRGL